ncbi:hypothetical protein F7725_023457 [Dissostichus mawsoni]|uniref:Zinc finger C3HC4 RING-type domain-containing protein n=1 Tax=Dissostichus mawsoni TaxID=36200 RepID=A0A7J5Z0R8_DISMA|nr:hypothetical protein F7725_023457 [Dissostichus mawsoni]
MIPNESELDSSWSVPTSEASSVDSEAYSVSASESTEEDEEPSSQSDHSFCRDCLQSWWTGKVINECPLCKRRSSRSEPPSNLVLKNLCESFTGERSEIFRGSLQSAL